MGRLGLLNGEKDTMKKWAREECATGENVSTRAYRSCQTKRFVQFVT